MSLIKAAYEAHEMLSSAAANKQSVIDKIKANTPKINTAQKFANVDLQKKLISTNQSVAGKIGNMGKTLVGKVKSLIR